MFKDNLDFLIAIKAQFSSETSNEVTKCTNKCLFIFNILIAQF